MGVLKLNDISYTGGGSEGSSTLSELSDVDISSPSNGQVLKYNGTSLRWENGTGGGASAMSDLTDVDLTGLEDGNSLVYDDTDDEWKVQTITKEVTQAEYDALVQAGTVDLKTAYFIKDTNGDGQDFQPVIRSLEEREIGVWTDGKPLYEKTVYEAGGRTGTITIAHNITNLGHCVNAFGTSYDLGWKEGSQRIGAGDLPLPRIASDGNNIGIIGVNNTYVNLHVPNAFTDRVTDIYITLQYTKSTDTAGSGTWTPQGVPAVHYSTNEKVVGTWIDGSTIYERVWDFGSNLQIEYNGWTTTSIPKSGYKMFLSAACVSATGSLVGEVYINIVDTDYVQLQTPKNGNYIFARYVIVRYIKSSS